MCNCNWISTDPVARNHQQIAMLTFSSVLQETFTFNRYQTIKDVKEAILNTTYQGGGTLTDMALDYAATKMFTQAKGKLVMLRVCACVCVFIK